MKPFILPQSSQQWLNSLIVHAGIAPLQQGEQWLLHLLPHSDLHAITLRIVWFNNQWQLMAITNAEDWLDMGQKTEQICIDFSMERFWYCHAGPILPHERSQRLMHFLTALQSGQFTVQRERIAGLTTVS